MDDDRAIGRLLRDLRAVRVYVYEGIEDDERIAGEIRTVRENLVDDGWANIATVRDGADNVAVLLRPSADGQGNRGLAVIVQDSSDLVLVN